MFVPSSTALAIFIEGDVEGFFLETGDTKVKYKYIQYIKHEK